VEDQRLLDAVVEADVKPLPDTFTLSSGVVLRAKRVAPLRIDAINRQYKDPEVPMVELEDGRKVENPDHPKYIEKLRNNTEERDNALLNAFMLFGTEVVSIPETIRSIDNSDWVDEMELVGIHVPDNKLARYLAWMRYEALLDAQNDMAAIMQHVLRKMAIAEENIAEAMQSFRGEEERSSNPAVLPEAASVGDNHSSSAGLYSRLL
jgi:hypothetical protein